MSFRPNLPSKFLRENREGIVVLKNNNFLAQTHKHSRLEINKKVQREIADSFLKNC